MPEFVGVGSKSTKDIHILNFVRKSTLDNAIDNKFFLTAEFLQNAH